MPWCAQVHCSPATVSRGGVIYINTEDVGWKPVVDSWIEKLEAAEYRPLLTTLFTRYVDVTLDYCRRNFKTVVPLPAVNQVCGDLQGGGGRSQAGAGVKDGGGPDCCRRALKHR